MYRFPNGLFQDPPGLPASRYNRAPTAIPGPAPCASVRGLKPGFLLNPQNQHLGRYPEETSSESTCKTCKNGAEVKDTGQGRSQTCRQSRGESRRQGKAQNGRQARCESRRQIGSKTGRQKNCQACRCQKTCVQSPCETCCKETGRQSHTRGQTGSQKARRSCEGCRQDASQTSTEGSSHAGKARCVGQGCGASPCTRRQAT